MSPLKVVLDGTLFSECEMTGANRDGMMRLAEDVTAQLVKSKDLEISFAADLYIESYHTSLKRFVSDRFPDHIQKIFSRQPPAYTNLVTWRNIFRKRLSQLSFSTYYPEISNCDIFHSFYYPFSKAVSRSKIKKSITFLDIIPLRLPGYPKFLVDRTSRIVDSAAENFSISISEFSRQDLLEYDKRVNPEKVFVAPLAASRDLFYPNKDRDAWETVKQKYKLPDNYFLSVAGNDPRKNIHHLVKSFNKFILQEKSEDICLLLTGNGAHNRSLLKGLNIDVAVRRKIVIPDRFIESDDMAVLYSNAVAFFFMSVFEGFGLPALEAMQCGVPVVTANTTSLPEVVGNAGIMLNPLDEDALCQAMTVLANDSSFREVRAELSIKRAAEFSWELTSDAYAKHFKSISSNF